MGSLCLGFFKGGIEFEPQQGVEPKQWTNLKNSVIFFNLTCLSYYFFLKAK